MPICPFFKKLGIRLLKVLRIPSPLMSLSSAYYVKHHLLASWNLYLLTDFKAQFWFLWFGMDFSLKSINLFNNFQFQQFLSGWGFILVKINLLMQRKILYCFNAPSNAGYCCGRKCQKEESNVPYADAEYEYFEQRQLPARPIGWTT